MIDPPRITRTEPQLYSVIHLTVPREEMRKVMGPGVTELMEAIDAQGLHLAGPWFTHHLRLDPDTFDFEIGVPVATPVVPTGRVRSGHRPAMRVARTIFRGAYEGLPDAWGEFDAWIVAEGHAPGPDLWEWYVTGPESSPWPAAWRTELNRPLVD
ncbi:MAG TPA: GyrI-like domain-containing protein [Longimicrobiales bacterium]|nr:GyrI-like domain-containing protein [Longimicrobiales bacterium]